MWEVLVTIFREEIGTMESSFIDVLSRPVYFSLGLIFWNLGEGLMKREKFSR